MSAFANFQSKDQRRKLAKSLTTTAHLLWTLYFDNDYSTILNTSSGFMLQASLIRESECKLFWEKLEKQQEIYVAVKTENIRINGCRHTNKKSFINNDNTSMANFDTIMLCQH